MTKTESLKEQQVLKWKNPARMYDLLYFHMKHQLAFGKMLLRRGETTIARYFIEDAETYYEAFSMLLEGKKPDNNLGGM